MEVGDCPPLNMNAMWSTSVKSVLNPLMPAGTYMYRQRAENSNFSDFDDNIFSFDHQMGICAKNYKNLPSRFIMGINGLSSALTTVDNLRGTLPKKSLFHRS